MRKVKLNSEEWLSVKDLDGEQWTVLEEQPFYAISNYGRLKRLHHVYVPPIETEHVHHRTLSERICKLYKNSCGYLCFKVTSNGKIIQLYIHRLVAYYFISNPQKLKCVNHKNEDKADNRAINLEWCTDKYNSNYGTCQERRAKSVNEMRRDREISIDQYTIDGVFVQHYTKKGEIEDNGFNLKTILRVCNHKMISSNGYIWRFHGDPYTKPVYNDSKGGTVKKKVLCYDLEGKFIAEYDSLLSAALAVGGKNKRTGICECAYGKREHAFGFIWKYKK